MKRKKIARRKFLRQIGCSGMGMATFLSSYNNLSLFNKLIGTASSPPSDYKALVCVLLAGGNDSFNMLAPKGTDEHAEYAATRSDLAIPKNDLRELVPITSIGKELGVHPSMPDIQQLFNNGELAFINNIGTLVEPIPNANEYNSGNYERPVGLYSHSDQIQQWQTSMPQSREAVGWGGRMADLLKTMNTNQNISMNVSLAGRNVFQAGKTVLEYSISNQGDGVEGIKDPAPFWMSNGGYLSRLGKEGVSDMATELYANVFKETFANTTDQAIISFEEFKKAVSKSSISANFSSPNLSQDLKMIARVIGAREALGMSRQTFFVTFGGWDHHNELLMTHSNMLNTLNNGINEFMIALDELGIKDKVTLFTASDFGRSLTTNGNGADHAWGGNSMVAGGAVVGKEFYGDYPDLYITGNPLMVHPRGHLLPTTSTDQLFAELALWFGVDASDLPMILPNIGEFYDITSGVNPLGFLP